MSPAEQSALESAQRCASRCVELDTENQRLSTELAIWHAKPDRDKQWRSEALGIMRQRTTGGFWRMSHLERVDPPSKDPA